MRDKVVDKITVIREDETGATYQIGNARVEIVAPQITEEERERRLKEIIRTWQTLHSTS